MLAAFKKPLGVIAAILCVPVFWTVVSATTPPERQEAPASVFQAYACPAGDAEAVAQRLRAACKDAGEVRIAADPRTCQVIVQAPAEIHAKIARLLAQGDNQPAVAAETPNTAVSTAKPSETTLALHNSTSQQVEQSLTQLLGARLSPATARGADVKSYLLSAGSDPVRLDIYRRPDKVGIHGSLQAVASLTKLIQALDVKPSAAGRSTQAIALTHSSAATARKTAAAVAASTTAKSTREPMLATIFQPPVDGEENEPSAPVVGETAGASGDNRPTAGARDAATVAAGDAGDGDSQQAGGLIGPVQVEMLDGLDVLVLRGHSRDVARVTEIIDQIEKLSTETEPALEVYRLKNLDCAAISEIITPLYDQMFSPRRGFVSITALMRPNALLLVGRRESVDTVIDLVKKLDRPSDPESQFKVFRLRHAAAATAQTTVNEFFAARGGLGPRVRATADFRSNALIVQANRQDMTEVSALVTRLDTSTSDSVNELRVFQLENSLAEDIAPILQTAVSGQQTQRTGAQQGVQPGMQQGMQPGQQGQRSGANDPKSSMLRFVTVDSKGQNRLESGILTDVRITADTRGNALIVSAPAESMDLLEALIRQLDKMPAAEAQIKVFSIVNGDATSLVDMLQSLFSRQSSSNQMGGLFGGMGGGARVGQGMGGSISGENAVILLRFAVDTRTNCIIASGTRSDLQVVEAILLRMDDSDVRQRKSIVYRLKNAPANDVAQSINEFLRSERQVQQASPGLTSPFEQIEREVVVVPEPVSNSLIVSATPRYFEDIRRIVVELDQRPPMVMIQVLIAEVVLNNTDEFGVELGLQDSVLFDRSLLGDIVTTSTTTYANSQPVSQNQTIQSATYTPGFGFNNQPLGQSSGTGDKANIGSQGLSNFGVGRMNGDLGFGGLVLSASSESVSLLIRALKENRRLDVLSRPQVMTLDNQPAFIQVGQRVPRITGSTINQTGQVNNIAMENVGLILGVTPRISPDGLVVMEIDAEKSEVGPEAEGIPVSISATGVVIRSPKINTTTAQTTVSSANGQTVVLGGLISKSKSETHRKVPLLGDIPVLGSLFRYDSVVGKRVELLIIMTPHIVRSEADAEAIKRLESSRMHWCLGDVLALQGKEGGRSRTDNWSDSETNVIYPDMEPGGKPMFAPGQSTSPVAVPQGFVPTNSRPAPLPLETIPTPAPVQSNIIEPQETAPGPRLPEPTSGNQFRFRESAPSRSPQGATPGDVQPAGYQGPVPVQGQNAPTGVAPAAYAAPMQGYAVPAQGYAAPAQGYAVPAQRPAAAPTYPVAPVTYPQGGYRVQ